MKKLSILALAAVGLLFGACSSNESVDEGKNPLLGNDNGFFKVNLNLPSSVVTSTRAGWADEGTNVDDGLPKEYAVNSVLLLIFEGDNEGAATLKQVMTPITTITPDPDPSATDNPNQVTSVREYVAQLDNAPTSNLYALAVINGAGIIEAGTVNTAVSINGGEDKSGITLAGLQVETANSMKEGDRFFMTNAVLSKKHGGDADPSATPSLQILAPVKTEYIYETKAAAEAGVPATDIYVERGVAKVTLTPDATHFGAAALKMKGGAAITPSFEGWVLDNTENKSYIVRKVPSTFIWNLKSYDPAVTVDPYRFVGGNAVDKLYGTQNLYRTYWAIDLNYDNDATGKTTSTSLTFPAKTAVGDDYPQYCHENTFDVAHQTYQNTTRAVVKVNLSANDFYTIGADRNTLYTLDNVEDLVKTDLMDQSAFAAWWQTQSTHELTAEDLTIIFSSDDAGVVTVTDVTVDKEKCDKIAHATDPSVKTEVGAAVITTLNNSQLGKVEYFQGGVSYYQIRIKHFGDDLTPWNEGEYATAPVVGDVDAIYPDDARRDANYLGRYGMVRNNWYDIHLGAILKIGSSTVPTLDGTPDDNLDEVYIKARINILSWAKRTQNWTLK